MRISDWSSDVCSSDLVRKNIVTRARGVENEVQVDVIEDTVEVDDILLLCSDGLNDMVDDETIGLTLQRYAANLETAAQRLVELAKAAGGKDNVSVVLARADASFARGRRWRSEEHPSELQSLMRHSYAVFCLHTTQVTSVTLKSL